MVIHYDSSEAAKAHLIGNGWKLVEETGFWVSRDGSCRASIHPIPGIAMVRVGCSEIPAA